jgi:hypothetical protein
LIQNSQSLINKLKTKIKGLEEGDQLSPELRTEMAAAVTSLYTAQVKALAKDPFIQSKKSELQRYNVDPNDTIIGELGAFDSNQTSGEVEVQALDGTIGTIPADQLEEALNAGYTKI